MTFTATITESKLDVDRLAGQLAAFGSFFAAQPDPADDDRGARAAIPGRVEPVPGEPVDTSHHDASRSPAASTGAPAERDVRKSRNRSNKRRD